MDKMLLLSLLYALAIVIVIWYAVISPAIANYIGKNLLNTKKKIIVVFYLTVLPLIISALTGKIFASYVICIMFILLYLELKNERQ